LGYEESLEKKVDVLDDDTLVTEDEDVLTTIILDE